MHRVEGSYALGILFREHPDHIYAARKDSPLVVGHSRKGNLIASDVPAMLQYTRKVYYIENEEIVCLSKNHLQFYNIDGEPLEKESETIDWDIDAAEKGGYEFFMLKEIYEQPKAIRDTISPRLKDNDVVIQELDMTDEEIRQIKRIMIIACGSASYVGQTAR